MSLTKKVELPESMEGQTLLVAGAAGFVPSHICEHYLKLGAKVIGLDNFLTGDQRNLSFLSPWKNFQFFSCDITQELPSFQNTPIDFILSLASPASPIDFGPLSLEIMRVNSEGTRQLLELARKKKARFLEASTSEVYGDPEIHPQIEEYTGCVNPIGVRACYDESKRFAEALTMSYHRRYGIETRIARIFNTYGPRMRPNDGRVIPNFIAQALSGEDITIYGDGSQTRSFCYVTDLVQAIHTVLFSDDPSPFNCGNPVEYSIRETANRVVDILNSPSKLKFLPLPKDDPQKRCPNISKLQSISDYTPTIDFVTGIKRTAEYFLSLPRQDSFKRPHSSPSPD